MDRHNRSQEILRPTLGWWQYYQSTKPLYFNFLDLAKRVSRSHSPFYITIDLMEIKDIIQKFILAVRNKHYPKECFFPFSNKSNPKFDWPLISFDSLQPSTDPEIIWQFKHQNFDLQVKQINQIAKQLQTNPATYSTTVLMFEKYIEYLTKIIQIFKSYAKAEEKKYYE